MLTLRNRILNRYIVQKANYGARVGETIAGNLIRGAGGRFSSGGGGSSHQLSDQQQAAYDRGRQSVRDKLTAKKPKAGGKGKGKAKPKSTPESKQQAADAKKAENINKVDQALQDSDASISPTGLKQIMEIDSGKPIDEQTGANLEKLGYTVKNPDGTYRLSPEGKSLAAAANRGDVDAARAADGKAQERAKKFAETQAKAEEPKGGGGGGGKQEETPEQKAEAERQKKVQTSHDTAIKVGLTTDEVDELRSAAEGTPVQSENLSKLGFIDADGNSTDAGRQALSALEAGDIRKYQAAVQGAGQKLEGDAAKLQKTQETEARRAKAEQERQTRDNERKRRQMEADARRQAREAALNSRRKPVTLKAQKVFGGVKRDDLPDSAFIDPENRSFPVNTAQDVKDAVSSWGRYKGPLSFDEFKSRLIRRAKAIGAASALPSSWMEEKSSQLLVIKQKDGSYRWVSVSSTAFKDIDKETVTKAAIAADCDYADLTGDYGPLLWWHSVPIGKCDFNMIAGPLLIESGTFNNAQLGELFSQKSAGLGMSIGFKRLPWEPNQDGVYTFIRRKERSALPRKYAANVFTKFIAYRENDMADQLNGTKIKQLAEWLEIPEADAIRLVEKEIQEIRETAANKGLVEKAAATPDDPTATDEPMPADATEPSSEIADKMEDLADTQGAAEIFTSEELQSIAQAIAPVVAAAVIEQLGPALNMETKLGKMVEEIKGLVGGSVTKEQKAADDRFTQLETKLKEAEAKISELIGDQPGNTYRPTNDGSNSLIGSVLKEIVTKSQKASGSTGDPLDAVVDGILGSKS